MKLKDVQIRIEKAMSILDNIDCLTIKSKKTFIENQKKINVAYNVLDKIRDEIIKERVMNKFAKQEKK